MLCNTMQRPSSKHKQLTSSWNGANLFKTASCCCIFLYNIVLLLGHCWHLLCSSQVGRKRSAAQNTWVINDSGQNVMVNFIHRCFVSVIKLTFHFMKTHKILLDFQAGVTEHTLNYLRVRKIFTRYMTRIAGDSCSPLKAENKRKGSGMFRPL